VETGKRWLYPDLLRGLTILSMVAYHTCWDLVYLAGHKWAWYSSPAAYWWQQSICWTFILLSGYSRAIGKRHLRHGILISVCGILVTAVTFALPPQSRILFGVLTFLGSAMLLSIPLGRLHDRLDPRAGIVLNFLLFLAFRHLAAGYIGFGIWKLKMPEALYHGYFMTYLGCMEKGFESADYFPLFPWYFLFCTGWHLYRLLRFFGLPKKSYLPSHSRGPVKLAGRHSLFCYLLHQPLIYMILMFLHQL
jgi:uncharacterized membrane protein